MLFSLWPPARAVSTTAHFPPLYPADLLPKMQDALRVLADINVRQEIEREKIERELAQPAAAKAA